MSSKGKGKAKEVVSGKRKSSGGGAGESRRKRKNPGVLQFFEDAADVDGNETSDEDDWDNVFTDKEPDFNVNNQTGKAHTFPFVPKEEVIEEEFDKMMEEQYKDGAGFVTYAEDSYEAKGSIDGNSLVPSSKDPTLWKVKCVVGRERHSAFCLMQKFVDMKSLGNKLQIISAFSVDHIKGFFYIEADRQCDINEACKGLTYIYPSRVAIVPSNEVYHLLSVRAKRREVSKGTWARVKSGNYKGDLCQVVAANNERKRATVKLIPRIDLQAMAAKFGGGVSTKKTVIPAPKLISSSELEEFLPLIQYRRDRDTGIVFQILDGLMLKDGYLYKRVSIDSISCWGVMPTEEELLKFTHSDNNESGDLEWLSQLYGENKRKKTVKTDKGGEKGEGSSGFSLENGFELHDLVCFGRKDFGLIVGMEKDGQYKILKDAPEGPVVVTVERRELKGGPLDTKFTASDHHSKTISINDTVKVLEGQNEGKQGMVKQIYRGIVFVYDDNETDNGGFYCCKSHMCEKIKQTFDGCKDKGGEPEPDTSGFEDFTSSPKSPLSPKKSWQEKETRSDFNKGNRDGMFSIGQTLRIRVGPLKGYLCRVIAVHYSDVTVKLDSKQKVLTVKNEHLAEVQGKSYAANTSEHDGSSSFKPFDLGAEGSSGDWLNRSGASAEGGGWNAERNSWPSFSAGTSNQAEASNSNACGSWDTDLKKDAEDTAWGCKLTSNQSSSWGAAVCSEDNNKDTAKQNSSWATGGSEQVGSGDGWNKATPKNDSGTGASDAWGKAITSTRDASVAPKDAGGSWGQATLNIRNPADSSNITSWDKGKSVAEAGSWGNKENPNVSDGRWKNNALGSNQQENWGKMKDASGSEDNSWGKAAEKWSNKDGPGESKRSWGSSALAPENAKGGWGSTGGSLAKPEAGNTHESSAWKKANAMHEDQTTNWNRKNVNEGATGWAKAGSWNQSGGGSSWGKHDAGSSWSKQVEGSSGSEQPLGNAESNQNDGWNKPSSGSNQGSGGWEKQKMESEYGKAPQDSGWGKGGNSNSKSGGASQDSNWGRKNDSHFGSGEATQDTSWGKKSDLNSEPGDINRGSNWGKKSSWGSGPIDAGQDSGWTKKGSWNSGSDSAKQDQGWGKKNLSGFGSDDGTKDSNWGKKRDWNSGPANSNQDPNWGNKSAWGAEPGDSGQASGWSKNAPNSGSGNAGQDSGWGKKSNWNSGPVDASQDSGWGKKSNWNSGPGDASQDSGWGQKSNWNSGSGNEDQSENFSNRGSGGSWRGGFGGRDGSDRGFRGRGNTDTGGFRGRGRSERGGYGGWERSDAGGFGGSRSDGESFGGRGGDRGGYRGRGGDRGGFGGRGRGRRDHNGGWSNGGDSGQDKSFSWNKEDNNGEGWKSKTWNQSNADQGGQSSSWNQSKDVKEGGWNKGTASTNEAGGSQDNSWKSPNSSAWTKSSSWNQPTDTKDVRESNNQGHGSAGGWDSQGSGWNRGAGSGGQGGGWNQSNTADRGQSSGQAGGWGSQGSGWNRGAGSGYQAGTGTQSNTGDRGQSSGQVESKDVEATRGNQDSWGKAASSSWGQGSGGSKGGW